MKFYGSIEKAEKQDDGTIHVSGYASSEAVDADGEIIKSEAIKDAIPEFMKFANVREMHQPKAAGTVVEMSVQPDGRTFVKTHIVDAEAVKKVENKVYKGFSVGGKVTGRDETDSKIIKGIKLSEISLVDRPANPEAVFTFYKIEDAEKAEDALKKADDAKRLAAQQKKTLLALNKGMYGISDLAITLSAIQGIVSSAEFEKAIEGDDSGMPEALKAWLKSGAEILKEMVIEETEELIEEDKEEVEMRARIEGLVKAVFSAADAEKFLKYWPHIAPKGARLLKAGARHSKSDNEHLSTMSEHVNKMQKAHDKMGDSLEECHKCMKGLGIDGHEEHTGDDATGNNADEKGAGKNDDVKKLQNDLSAAVAENTELAKISEALAKRVKELEDLPAIPAGALRLVSKNDDLPAPEENVNKNKTVKRSEIETRRDALVKAWSAPIPINPDLKKKA